jgi:autotransporter-associated beta strand protein
MARTRLGLTIAILFFLQRCVFAEPAITLKGARDGSGGNTADMTVGWQFVVNYDVTVLMLGVWDKGAGNEAHEVGLWDENGALLASAAVPPPSDAKGIVIEEFRYAPIAPLRLDARHKYVIGALYAKGTIKLAIGDSVGVDIECDPSITWLQQRSKASSNKLQMPESPSSGSTGICLGTFGPNFMLKRNSALPPDNVLLERRGAWKYLHPLDGKDPGIGNTFYQPAFDDSPWKTAEAPLGYGYVFDNKMNAFIRGDIGTPPGSASDYCAYFRKEFQVSNPSAYSMLRVELACGDGAAVYLNGKKLMDWNMPFGPPSYRSSSALGTLGGITRMYVRFCNLPNYLVEGRNVLAVEVHNTGEKNALSGLCFDMALSGIVSPINSNWLGGARDFANDWGRSENWAPQTVPDTLFAEINLGRQGSAPLLDLGGADRTVGAMNFAAPVTTAVQSAAGRTLIFNSGSYTSTITIAGTHRIQTPLKLESDLAINNNGQLTINTPISGEKGMILEGPGTTVLGTANSFSGVTRPRAGKLVLQHGQALQQSTVDLNLFDSGTLVFDELMTAMLGGLTGSRRLLLDNSAGKPVLLHVGNNGTNVIYDGALIGKGGLVKLGTGVLNLSGSNTYTGPTIVNQGVLRLRSAIHVEGFGKDGTGWTIFGKSAGGTGISGDVFTLTEDKTSHFCTAYFNTKKRFFGGFVVNFTYKPSFSPGETGSSGRCVFILHDDPGFARAISEGDNRGGLSLTVPESLRLASGEPQRSIALELNLQGTVFIRTTASTGGQRVMETSISPVNLLSGNPIDVCLIYDGQEQVVVGIIAERNTGNTCAFTARNTNTDFERVIGGQSAYVGFTSSAAGTLRQEISNFSATFFAPGGGNVLPSGTSLHVAEGAALDLNGTDQTIGSLASGRSGKVLLNDAVLTVGSDGSNSIFSGTLSGPGSLVKTGAGNLTLANSNTYTGSTTVSGGTLIVNGALAPASPVVVNKGAALGGGGRIGGTVHIAAGGRLAPGADVGTLSIGSLVLGDGGALDFQCGPERGDTIDVLNNHALVIKAGAVGVNLLDAATGQSLATAGKYKLIRYLGNIGGAGIKALKVLNPRDGFEYRFDTEADPGYVDVIATRKERP